MTVATLPGDPERVASLATQLGTIGAGLSAGAATLASVGVGDWDGPAATAFLSVLGLAPAPLRIGGEAFVVAAQAVGQHAAVLEAAQEQARLAAMVAEDAHAATGVWSVRVSSREVVQRRASAGDAGAVAALAAMPALGADPGAEGRGRAERLLAEAREMVAVSARHTAAVLARAAALAPREPSLPERSLMRGLQLQRQVAFGAGESLADLGALAWRTSLPWAAVHPRQWMSDQVGMAKGYVNAAQHPVELGKSLVDWDTWATNPARALGHVGGNALGAAVTGGGAAAGEAGLISRLRPSALFRKAPNAPYELSLVSFAEHDPLGTYARNVRPLEGHYDVAAHGNELQVQVHGAEGQAQRLGADQLAKLIVEQPDYDGGPVRLLSCFTGSSPTGIAQQLADQLGVNVVAPSSKLWMWDTGRMAIGLEWELNDGEWLTFTPRGN
ncbi:MAG: putative T7SS-secreted protein [Oryzihumus sp.]